MARLIVATVPPRRNVDDPESPGSEDTVAGLGEKAIWGSSGNLLVCTARGLLSVDMEQTASTMAPDDEKQAAMRIAGNALTRLEPDSR